MGQTNFIGATGCIAFLILLFYSFKISNDFFMKNRKENNV